MGIAGYMLLAWLLVWGGLIVGILFAAFFKGLVKWVRNVKCRYCGHKYKPTDFGGPDVCTKCNDWK